MHVETRRRFHRLFTCRVFWTAALGTVAYIVLAAVLPEQPFLEFVRILQATTAVIVVVAFSGDAWESITREKPEASDSLVIGIFLGGITGFVTGFWLLCFRLGGREVWMLNTDTFAFFSGWLGSLASILLVYPVGVLRSSGQEGEVPPSRLRAAGVVAAIGVFATLVVLASQPDIRWLLEIARPWLP